MTHFQHGFPGPERPFGEFSLRLLRNYTRVSVEEPMGLMDQFYFRNKLTLIWLYLTKMRVILKRKRYFNGYQILILFIEVYIH